MKKTLFLATLLAVITVVNAQQPRFSYVPNQWSRNSNWAHDNLTNETVSVGSEMYFQDCYIANEAQRAIDAYDKDHKCRPVHLFLMGYLDQFGNQVKAFPWWCNVSIPALPARVVTTTATTGTTTNRAVTTTTTGTTTTTASKLDATCYFIEITTRDTITMNGTVQGGVFSPETMKSGDLWASVAGSDGKIFQNLSFCGGWVTATNGAKKWYPAIAKEKGGFWMCNNYAYLKKDFIPSPDQTESVFHTVAAN